MFHSFLLRDNGSSQKNIFSERKVTVFFCCSPISQPPPFSGRDEREFLCTFWGVYMPALKEGCESKNSTSLKGNLWKLFYLILFQNGFQIYSLEPDEMH